MLEVDKAELLERHAERVTLSPSNSGATFAHGPAPRGPDTSRRIADYPDSKPVVELAVNYAVPDVAGFVLSMSGWHGAEKVGVVWNSPSRGLR